MQCSPGSSSSPSSFKSRASSSYGGEDSTQRASAVCGGEMTSFSQTPAATANNSNGAEGGGAGGVVAAGVVISDYTRQHDQHQQQLPPLPPKLTWYKMAFICFIFTAGGPFGMESVMRNGGPLFALIATIGVVLLHVFPMILIVTELSGMMPSNRGSVEWIDRAYGHEVGFVSSLLQVIINLIDLSVYPVLVRGYIEAMIDLNSVESYFVGLGVLLFASIPSFFSTSDLGNFAFVCMGLTIAPFVVGVIYGIKDIDPSMWGEMKHGAIDISTLTSVSIWMYTGFMALGNLGGEVESPKVFLVGCGSAAILDCVMYLLPLLVTIHIKGNWDDGFFADAFDKILPGLGWAILGAGAVSGYAMYASSLTCFSRSLWGVADKKWLPHFLTRTIRSTGAPYASMFVHIGVCCVLILFDFDFLVTLLLLISAANFLLFYTGFLVLRYREPHAHRPWRIPGGKFGAWFIVSPIITIYFGLFFAGLSDWVNTVILGAIVVVLVLIYFLFVRKAIADENRQQLLRSAAEEAVLFEVPVRAGGGVSLSSPGLHHSECAAGGFDSPPPANVPLPPTMTVVPSYSSTA